jgi:cell division protein FtsB
MSFGGPFFVLAIIAMSMGAWIITTAIRAKHGYPLEGEWGGTIEKKNPELERQNQLLAQENDLLRGKIGRLEERLSVLERIATDAPARLTAEIENLR